jgi:preprotein translocase subunit SecA
VGDAAGEPESPAEDHRPLFRAKGLDQPRRAADLQYSAPTAEGSVEHRSVSGGAATLTADEMANTPRNAPCPCGSGKKFKMCHGKS